MAGISLVVGVLSDVMASSIRVLLLNGGQERPGGGSLCISCSHQTTQPHTTQIGTPTSHMLITPCLPHPLLFGPHCRDQHFPPIRPDLNVLEPKLQQDD